MLDGQSTEYVTSVKVYLSQFDFSESKRKCGGVTYNIHNFR